MTLPFYVVEQVGVPGKRLVEATKPASALEHVVANSFTVNRVDGRDLIAAAKECELEVAGAPKAEPESDEPGDEPGKVNGADEPEPAKVNGDDEPAAEEPAVLPGGGRVDLNDPPRVNPDDEE